jgi:hypothetical protein
MTLHEICEKYKYTEATFQKNFKRCQAAILKEYNVRIIKEGRGEKATYREQILSDNRQETIFKALEPTQKTGLIKDDLSMENFTFTTFLGIITTPMLVFRGTRADFLNYIGATNDDKHLELLDKAIDQLVNEMIIHEIQDTTTEEEVLTLSLVRKAEVDMKISISMINICKQLAEQAHMHDWIPILKIWLGTELLSQKEHYTLTDLMNMTGVNKAMLAKCTRLLKQSNIYKTSKAYAGYQKCLGLKAEMNNEAFYKIEEK